MREFGHRQVQTLSFFAVLSQTTLSLSPLAIVAQYLVDHYQV